MLKIRQLLPLACALALPVASHAQDSTAVAPRRTPEIGARVLVTLPRAEGYEDYTVGNLPPLWPRIVGRVVQVTSDSLWVQSHPSVSAVAVPQGVVRRVYVSRGRPRGPSVAWGAAHGSLLGAMMGVGVAYPRLFIGGERRDRPQVLALYAVSGAISGMITGAMYPRERWREVR